MNSVLHTESSTGWGGQEIRILLEACGLRERGWDVSILCQPQSRLAIEGPRNGVPTYLLKMKSSFDLKALWAMTKLLKEKAFTVLNTHSSVDSWLGCFAAKIAKVPVLLRTRHLSVPIGKHPLNIVYKMPDAIMTTGESIRRMLIEDNRLNGERIFSVPTGVALDRFRLDLSGDKIKEEFQLAEDRKIVSIVAVLRSWKRHEIFIEAARCVLEVDPSIVFFIVGDGPRRDVIRRTIKEKGLERDIMMLGHRSDVEAILAATDVCVLTSDAAEGVPQAVVQYLAMGKPVVATKVGSVPELIKHEETGLLVAPNDYERIGKSILRLLKDKELARKLGASGRYLVETEYDKEIMLDRVIQIYSNVYSAKI